MGSITFDEEVFCNHLKEFYDNWKAVSACPGMAIYVGQWRIIFLLLQLAQCFLFMRARRGVTNLSARPACLVRMLQDTEALQKAQQRLSPALHQHLTRKCCAGHGKLEG